MRLNAELYTCAFMFFYRRRLGEMRIAVSDCMRRDARVRVTELCLASLHHIVMP